MNGKKFPPLAITAISHIFASKDADSPLYLKGPELVSLFNRLGFPDNYTFADGKGIQTLDYGDGLSRYAYAFRRLNELNDKFKVPAAIQTFIDSSRHPHEAAKAFQNALNSLGVQNHEIAPSPVTTTKIETIPHEGNGIDVKAPVPINETSNITKDSNAINQNQLLEEVLGKIPENHPVVFISYSWDSEDHKEWVAKLAKDLCENGIYVLLDQYLEDGTMLPLFMEYGIERADRIIVVGTESYKAKGRAIGTGASFEDCIISSEMLHNIGTKKFIPCLRQGEFSLSFPILLSSMKGHDFKKEENYGKELESLCREIWKKPLKQRPTLGPVPDYVSQN